MIIVGDATVGKTSFVQRYVNDVFREDYKGTVGGKIYSIIFRFLAAHKTLLERRN